MTILNGAPVWFTKPDRRLRFFRDHEATTQCGIVIVVGMISLLAYGLLDYHWGWFVGFFLVIASAVSGPPE